MIETGAMNGETVSIAKDATGVASLPTATALGSVTTGSWTHVHAGATGAGGERRSDADCVPQQA